MSGVHLGEVRLDLLDEGTFRLDGGAMFRVVPRPLWEPLAAPDARNRILLGLRPLLVRTAGSTILVESGLGAPRRDATFRERFDVRPGAGLEAGLAALGVAPDQVDWVVLTHLHFDHVGGLLAGDGRSPRFPRARVVVQREELLAAREECPLCKASYVEADFAPLEAAGRLQLLDGDAELVPGVHLEVTGGHTRAHQLVRVTGGGETAVFWGDLIPTANHLKPHWVMAYDLYPVEVWRAKERLVAQAAAEGWLSVHYHDPHQPWGRLRREGREVRLEPLPAG